MLGMRQVGFQTGLVRKGHEETVGETIVQVLRAHVGAPFKAFHRVDLLG